jgi:hypothetical protein
MERPKTLHHIEAKNAFTKGTQKIDEKVRGVFSLMGAIP